MKKLSCYFMAVLLVGVSLVQTGCFGSFSLTKKVYQFNKGVGDKFVQTLVMYALYIIPVYEIAGLADIVILNLIEFWTGSNPLAMKEGDIQIQTLSMNGNKYEVTATKNKFHIKQLSGKDQGKESDITFNPVNKTWNLNETKLIQFIEKDGTEMVNILKPDGSVYATRSMVDYSAIALAK